MRRLEARGYGHACSVAISELQVGRLQRHTPLGGVERPRRVVRVARLCIGASAPLGRPSASAACGGNLSLTWLPPRVIAAAPLVLLLARQSAGVAGLGKAGSHERQELGNLCRVERCCRIAATSSQRVTDDRERGIAPQRPLPGGTASNTTRFGGERSRRSCGNVASHRAFFGLLPKQMR